MLDVLTKLSVSLTMIANLFTSTCHSNFCLFWKSINLSALLNTPNLTFLSSPVNVVDHSNYDTAQYF